jgi:hypothetical protein
LWNAKEWPPRWSSSAVALKQRRFLRLAAKKVALSSGFVEASPETAEVLKVATKKVALSIGFVEASPETAEVLKVGS